MGFIIDYDKAQVEKGLLLPQGDYEALIDQAKIDTTMGGKEYIRFSLRVREDVNQEGAGQRLEYRLWKRREPQEADPQGFPLFMLQRLARCSGLQNGLSFFDLSDLLGALCGRPIKVRVKHEMYNEVTRAQVAKLMPSEKPPVMSGFVAVDAAELPF